MARWKTFVAAVAALFAMQEIVVLRAAAATLSGAGEISSSDPSVLEWRVSLSAAPGEKVAAIQFDLDFDSESLRIRTGRPISEGNEAKAADKQATCAEVAHGRVRVILAGLNQRTVANGDVAVAYFDLLKPARYLSNQPVTIRDAMLAGPGGVRIRTQAVTGSLSLPGTETPPQRGESAAIGLKVWVAGAALGLAVTGLLLARRRRARFPGRAQETRRHET